MGGFFDYLRKMLGWWNGILTPGTAPIISDQINLSYNISDVANLDYNVSDDMNLNHNISDIVEFM